MFRHILVPLDFSDKNLSALETARELAHLHRARVSLLHVIEVIHNVPEEELRTFYDGLEKRSRSQLRRSRESLDVQEIEVETEVVFGKRADEIVRFARERSIDLIVMSSQKLDPDNPVPWPTISHKVALLSPRPVLLVR